MPSQAPTRLKPSAAAWIELHTLSFKARPAPQPVERCTRLELRDGAVGGAQAARELLLQLCQVCVRGASPAAPPRLCARGAEVL